MTPPIMGIDPSLKGCGLVALPENWDGSWEGVARKTVGHSLPHAASFEQHVRRLEDISTMVRNFAFEHEIKHVGLESYPFNANTMAFSLGRLHGLLAVDLKRAGYIVHSVPLATCRKLLLGHVPRKGIKAAVCNHWRQLGAPWKSNDEADAGACANWLSGHLEGAFYEGMRLWVPQSEAAS